MRYLTLFFLEIKKDVASAAIILARNGFIELFFLTDEKSNNNIRNPDKACLLSELIENIN